MKANQQLDPGRVISLLRLDFVNRKRFYLIGLGAIVILYTFFLFLFQADGDPRDIEFHHNFFPLGLLLLGCYFSSKAFDELNNPLEKQTYLNLPASTLEKFTSKWIITVIIFPIAFLLMWIILSNSIALIIDRIIGVSSLGFNPMDSVVFLFLKLYVAIQGIYLIAAVLFSKYELLKITLASMALNLITAFIIVFLFRIIFYDYFDGFVMVGPKGSGDFNVSASVQEPFHSYVEETIPRILRYLLFIGVPILSWVVAYFKLKEKEL